MHKDETGEIVPALVSEKVWEKANEVLKKRSDDVKNRQNICNHKNLLTGKLHCTCCDTAYYRKESKDRQGNVNNRWVCSGKIKNGSASCPSFAIYESEIKPLLFDVFRETEDDAEAMLEKYAEMYESLDNASVERRMAAIRQELVTIERKKDKLLDFNIDGKISDEEYLKRTKVCEEEADTLNQELEELEDQLKSKAEFQKHMETVRAVMRSAQRDVSRGFISKDFIEKYIDKIFVTPMEDGCLKLEIKIFTGTNTEKYLTKLRKRADNMTRTTNEEIEESAKNDQNPMKMDDDDKKSPAIATGSGEDGRSGHTFKKMVEAYEKGLK